MPQRREAGAAWAILIVVALAAALYTFGLDRGPAYIGGDEAHFVSHAHSIATTGRDLNGERFPLFIKITDLLVPNHSSRIWYQPVLFYLLAFDFLFLPVDEWSSRLPTTLIAVLDILLVYLIARRLFDRRIGLIAAVLLALTPAHFILSRQALDYICPLPIVLGWLLLVIIHLQTRRTAPLIAAAVLLGAGSYTYVSSWVVMPCLALLTVAVVRPPLRIVATMVAGYLVPLLPAAAWLATHRQAVVDTLGRYRLDSVDAAASAGPDAFERVTVYWNYFNPSFLFFAGGSNPTMATRQVGVFLLPIAVFLAVGVFVLLRERTRIGALLLIAFVAAPAPIVLTMPDAPGYSVARALTLVPLGILIAAIGCQRLLSHAAREWRWSAAALLCVVPLQFGLFLNDYFGAYQARSAARIDPVATRDVMDRVIALDQSTTAPLILFSNDLDDKSVRWRFYSVKLSRLDLWQRARNFTPDRFDAGDAPPNSLLVLYAGDAAIARLLSDGCVKVAEVAGLSGEPATAILRRDGPAAAPQ